MSVARTVSFALAIIVTVVGLALTVWVSGEFFLLAFLAFALAVFTAPYELVRGADTEGSAGPVGSGDGGGC